MKTEALFLFLILLIGLFLCALLGGKLNNKEGFNGKFSGMFSIDDDTSPDHHEDHKKSSTYSGYNRSSNRSPNKYDHYNHYNGSSTHLTPGSVFYGENGKTAKVISDGKGGQGLQITLPGSDNPVTFTENQKKRSTEGFTSYHVTTATFYGPNGDVATVVNMPNGEEAIKVKTSNGTYYYNVSGSTSNSPETSTQYYGSTGHSIPQESYSLAYQGLAYQGPRGNTVYHAKGPAGGSVTGFSSGSSSVYASTLPTGIPKSQIPAGQEDLYILKSEVVPPVCPACPATTASCPRQEKCPPCPACARCPEPAFECKKVPNYNAINNDYLPSPVLNDFSQFGM
jgi:hypothetical protein